MGVKSLSAINQPRKPKQWIEYKRLEISIQMTAEDAQRQLQTLSGKNKAAFKSELSEWLEGTEKVNIEELEFMDYNSTW